MFNKQQRSIGPNILYTSINKVKTEKVNDSAMSCFCYWKGKNQKSNCRRYRDRKSFTAKPNYSTAQKKRRKKKLPENWIVSFWLLKKESTPHARLMTNPPIDQLKWNWIEPPGHESKCDSGQSDPHPLPPPPPPPLTTRLDTPGVHYQLWQQPLFLGEGQRNPCPLMAHSRVTVWKVHFDPCLLPVRDSHPPPSSPQECCLCSFDLWNDPWTLSVSVMFGLSDTEQPKGSASQILMWFRTGGALSLIIVCSILGGDGTNTTTTHLSLCWPGRKEKALCVFLSERRQIDHLIHWGENIIYH